MESIQIQQFLYENRMAYRFNGLLNNWYPLTKSNQSTELMKPIKICSPNQFEYESLHSLSVNISANALIRSSPTFKQNKIVYNGVSYSSDQAIEAIEYIQLNNKHYGIASYFIELNNVFYAVIYKLEMANDLIKNDYYLKQHLHSGHHKRLNDMFFSVTKSHQMCLIEARRIMRKCIKIDIIEADTDIIYLSPYFNEFEHD